MFNNENDNFIIICTICITKFVDPITTSCGHSFCKSCFDKLTNSTTTNIFKCPLCNTVINKHFKISVTLRDLIERNLEIEEKLKRIEEQMKNNEKEIKLFKEFSFCLKSSLNNQQINEKKKNNSECSLLLFSLLKIDIFVKKQIIREKILLIISKYSSNSLTKLIKDTSNLLLINNRFKIEELMKLINKEYLLTVVREDFTENSVEEEIKRMEKNFKKIFSFDCKCENNNSSDNNNNNNSCDDNNNKKEIIRDCEEKTFKEEEEQKKKKNKENNQFLLNENNNQDTKVNNFHHYYCPITNRLFCIHDKEFSIYCIYYLIMIYCKKKKCLLSGLLIDRFYQLIKDTIINKKVKDLIKIF